MFKSILCIAASALLLSCAGLPEQPQNETAEQPSAIQKVQFTDQHGGKYQLYTQDNFQHARLTDLNGRSYDLTQTISGSGIRLSNDQGVLVHFKADAGYILLEKDHYIDVSVQSK